MPGLLPDVDPDGLLEYSVVCTDRALNRMSRRFQGVMRDIPALLKDVYRARSAIVVPGSGTFGMEAVARQFATGQACLAVRNGWFSYRWSQILEMGAIASETVVLKAGRCSNARHSPFAPVPIGKLVMLSERARERIAATTSSSFACDLKKWLAIMEAYEAGGHAYHATMPTDALARLRDVMVETRDAGFENLRARQWELGRRVREALAAQGFSSVAAAGFEAPGVVVSYADDPEICSGRAFAAPLGLPAAAGVPLQSDEPADFGSWRVGLFGLEKLRHVDRTVGSLRLALRSLTPDRERHAA